MYFPPNAHAEHVAKLRGDGDFAPETLQRQTCQFNGKSFETVVGRLMNTGEHAELSYHYPADVWTDTEAREHCKINNGVVFAPAGGKSNDSPPSADRSMGLRMPHLAARIFDRPLMITKSKLDTILYILGPRLGLDMALLPTIEAAILEAERTDKGFDRLGSSIALIPVHGTLVNRSMALDALSGLTSYAQLHKAFAEALEDNDVEHIVFDIDSPGGEAGVFDLADTIYAARGQKPITALVNDSAFSAAYAIASAADRVVLPRMGGAGSVGVIATHIDQSGRDAQRGLRYEHIIAGAHKADFSPHSALSADARQTLQAEVDRAYEVFVDTVARNRGLTAKAVRDTQARIYFGSTAVNAGLADAVQSTNDALSTILSQAQKKGLRQALQQAQAKQEPAKLDAERIIKRCAEAGVAEIAPDCLGMTEEQLSTRLEQAQAIRDLCAAARCENDALAYIKANTPVEALRLALTSNRAKDEAPIDSRIMPGAKTSIDHGWDRAFSKLANNH